MSLKFEQKMTFKEHDEFETLFQDLLHLIEQETKLVEGLGAMLQQGSTLFDLLK